MEHSTVFNIRIKFIVNYVLSTNRFKGCIRINFIYGISKPYKKKKNKKRLINTLLAFHVAGLDFLHFKLNKG